MTVKIISIFNNKGGVGKTTLTFHLAHALAEMGKKVLLVDLDPQCNLSINCIDVNKIQEIWDAETPYIDEPNYTDSRKKATKKEFKALCSSARTVHFLLKPAEEGVDDIEHLPPLIELCENLYFLPGRLTLHMYEEVVAKRWSDAFIGNPLAIRTLSEIRRLIHRYAEENGFEIAIVDTSPSLGSLNKLALSMLDAFFIPCAPDIFSAYGVRNIGNSLTRWNSELKTLYTLIPKVRRPYMPDYYASFLGYSLYNAKKREGSTKLHMAQAHYNYAKEIPNTIVAHVPKNLWSGFKASEIKKSIGNNAIIHSHNTYPTLAQKYHIPMWRLPRYSGVDQEDVATIRPNSQRYLDTKDMYTRFATDVLARLDVSAANVEAI